MFLPIKPTMRSETWRRKRDGALVMRGDWPDGDVSWALISPPVISFTRIAGTCRGATFEKNHEIVQ